MFCGIGTIRMGFEQAGHECVYSIEWDKHKRRIYSVIFGSEPEGQDIRSVRATDIPKADCWCFGAPCQDFSIAGERKGLQGDRSSLVREVFRLLGEIEEEHRPKYLLYENVKGMLSSNKGLDYLEILIEMESLGYNTIEYSLLNSKDFGVPQNRERVFTVGHLRGRSGRKVFPIGGISSEIPIKVIGTTVNDIAQGTNSRHWVHDISGIVGALSATDYKQPKQIAIKEVGKINPNRHSSLANSVLSTEGISPTLDSMQGGNRQPKILVKENTKKGYVEGYPGDGIRLDHPGGNTGRGRVQNQSSPTLTTSCDVGTITNNLRIRKLTPKECWRLQGIEDSITDKVISASISP